MLAKRRVLISGSGIAGPCLAWFLAKTGAQVSIIEKAPHLLSSGQNIDIQGTARKIIDKMGLTDEVMRRHTTETGSAFINDRGQAFASFPVVKGRNASLTSEYEILRADLVKVLYEATKHHENITYTFGTTIERVLVNDEEKVQVELSDGEVHEYDIVVAADGQWSKTRRLCFDEADVSIIDKDMNAVYFTVPRTKDDNDFWNLYPALKSRIVTTRPDPYGTILACFTIMPLSSDQRKAWQNVARSDRKSKEALTMKEFGDAGWETQRLLRNMASAKDFYLQPVQQIRMAKWHRSRVVCLGDAGYAPTPLTGMGTSLAILGSYILAGELSLLKKEESPVRAFEAYDRLFRPFVEKSQQIPWVVPGIAHPEQAWKRWFLYQFVWLASKVVAIPWIANRTGNSEAEDFKLPVYPIFANVQNREMNADKPRDL